MSKNTTPRFEFLDSIRGLMAFWVMCGHLSTSVGATIPIIESHAVGVDVFIILSGFFMVFNYKTRASVEPWESPKSWGKFWLRRFFRIAPVYYVCYVISCLALPYLLEFQHRLVVTYQHPFAIDPLAPGSPVQWRADWQTVLLHLTFLFGLVPNQSISSTLPDWSLGLEAQYYLAFPFLMLFWARFKTLALIGAAFAFTFLSKHFASVGLHGNHGGFWFIMPSFLGFKCLFFLIGMLLADGICREAGPEKPGRRELSLIFAAAICGMRDTRLVVVIFLLIAACIYFDSEDTGLAAVARRLLENRFLVFLGDISYPVYLVHLLIILPVCSWLSVNPHFASASPHSRFLMAFALVTPLVVGFSYAIHQLIERPGISLGKRLVAKV